MLKIIYKKYEQFIRFCGVGVINTIFSLIIYTVCLSLGLHYILSSIIGYIAGIGNGYILSSKYVFIQELDIIKAIKFISIYLIVLAINLTIITTAIEIFGIGKIIAQIGATGFNVIFNYLLNKIWTFAKTNKEKENEKVR